MNTETMATCSGFIFIPASVSKYLISPAVDWGMNCFSAIQNNYSLEYKKDVPGVAHFLSPLDNLISGEVIVFDLAPYGFLNPGLHPIV